MIKPRDYDSAQTAQYGDAQLPALEAGGHGCVILKAETDKDYNGNDRLLIYFDIKEGSKADGYYKKKFDRQKQFTLDAKWQGIFRQSIYKQDGTTNPYFKGFVSSVQKSNPGYVFDFHEVTLKNKRIGFVFREEEFLDYQSQTRTTVKAAWACDFDSYSEMPVPKKRTLAAKGNKAAAQNQMTPADDEPDLPF